MDATISRPPFDPAVAAVLGAMGRAEPTPASPPSLDGIPAMRAGAGAYVEDLTRFDVEVRELTIPGYQGAELVLTVYTPRDSTGGAPGVFNIHGGAMIMGDRFTGMSLVLPFAVEYGAVVTTIEYRLAPEFPDPTPVEDCYAALVWVAENAAGLGIDPERILIAGASAGGGIAAGVALLARDRSGPTLIGQLLVCPMLDDRDQSVSTLQFEGLGLHDRESNQIGWMGLLGDRRAGDEVSVYAAPARATDLSGLPPAFIDVGSAEVFRDEDVAYASQIWADGGVAELHVWPGGTHGWEALAPQSVMAQQAAAARFAWVGRLLAV